MNSNFREKVQWLADQALDSIDGYFKGEPADLMKVKSMMQAIGFGVKIEHMNQLKIQGDKSIALRIMQFLPKDGDVREKYLKITNPELKPLLLDRPKKKK